MIMPQSFSFDRLHEVISNFSIPGQVVRIMPIGEGHINDTFHLKTIDSAMTDYVLQKINHSIFKDVNGLMENIERITSHINQKHLQNPITNKLCAPQLVSTDKNHTYLKDDKGDYWRCYTYIPHVKAVKISSIQAYEGGKAIGNFQVTLNDLPGGNLHETIPHFHDVKIRLDKMKAVMAENPSNRVNQADRELSLILNREEEMMQLQLLVNRGLIPWRITHNDTKFNNILFDGNEQAIAIIDLDTVMNGSVLFDFGDAVRTLCNDATEDEGNLSKVKFNMGLFERFASGYLSETVHILSEIEIRHLAYSCKLLTFIMAVRFLTDFLAGDFYFKIKHPMHNFQRAANQLRLLEQMEVQFENMETIIRKSTIG